MTIQTIERLLGELLSAPTHQLSQEQKTIVYDFATALFVGRAGDIVCDSPYTLSELQSLRALSHKQSFYVDYFTATPEGLQDLKSLGLDTSATAETIQDRLLDVSAMTSILSSEERKAMRGRSADWARGIMVAQLAKDASADAEFTLPVRRGVNYAPDKLLEKAASVRAYRDFYHTMSDHIAGEPDQLVASAERAVLSLYMGRLNAMAAVDVYPGLLSLEDQLTRSKPSPQIHKWAQALAQVAPAIGVIHEFEGEQRSVEREAYVRHLDAIRQGASFELDEVDEKEVSLFTVQTLSDLIEALKHSTPESTLTRTPLGTELGRIRWTAPRIQQFVEAVLAEWDMLSAERVAWFDVDHRDGFAPDEKFQVIITPNRTNMSVDSTRRIINIPADIDRPLAGLYPAGVLPLVAHELTHVLQAIADYELGSRIPLARIKGRRYRILREAGGVYQEYVVCRDYFGMNREPNSHYLKAYQAKIAGASRIAVARVFYESLISDLGDISLEEYARARELAVNRTSRLYRYGGHSSQALDYVEQSVVCEVLLRQMTPEQVNVFLLGGASFSIEDSASLHRFGLFELPDGPAQNPAQAVMSLYGDGWAEVVAETAPAHRANS